MKQKLSDNLLRTIFLVLLLVVILLMFIFAHKNDDKSKIDSLWSKTIDKYVATTLWDDINCYDAGHVLLVPMFYAFQTNDTNKIEQFHKLFENFADYLVENSYEYEYWNLNHLQFNFLASNYINLCTKANYNNRVRKELLNYLYDEAFYYSLLKRKTYKTEQNPQYSALVALDRDSKEGKISADNYQYHCSILFNLAEYSKNGFYELDEEREKTVEYAKCIINYIYTNSITFIDKNKWILDKGAFDEHQDFQYINYEKIEENMEPQKPNDTTWDVSHFARIPVFLQIYKRANKDDNNKYEYFEKLIKGLESHFINDIIVKPNSNERFYKTLNYMDGRNGLYRYNYTTQYGNAYLPYQLSGTMLLGWWSVLGNDSIQLYKDIYSTFPLDEKAINTYTGPNTTRERNELVKWPDFFENGFAELICLVSSKIDTDFIF